MITHTDVISLVSAIIVIANAFHLTKLSNLMKTLEPIIGMAQFSATRPVVVNHIEADKVPIEETSKP